MPQAHYPNRIGRCARIRCHPAGKRRSRLPNRPYDGRSLVELRDRWLNPPEWVEWVDEAVSGYPKPPVPSDEEAANALKKRMLTNLYNPRPQ
ncbi:MAG: hypothetical protein OXF41_01560 [bacterium]|nr:hypothetical protein [bacterium]